MVQAADARHQVRFYEDARALGGHVATFLARSLTSGGSAIAIAGPLTLAIVELRLANAGHDVATLQAQDRLILIDATELLPALLVDGFPDRARFREHVSAIVNRIAARGAPVHVYGEMVDVLWANGASSAVLALEHNWAELVRELESVTLVCGYPLRAFAQLEQRAHALESEIARRVRVEERMLALLELTGQLAAATDRATIGNLTVQNGMRALDAADGAVWLVDTEQTHLELLASSHNLFTPDTPRLYRTIALAGDTPVAHAFRSGEPLFLGSLDEYARRFPASRERLKTVITANGRQAFAFLPLVHDDRSFGCVVFTFAYEREFTSADRAFKSMLARQCATALARVQQHENERALRIEAEEATRAREEMLSVVSHDLRNPLGTILMDASSLITRDTNLRVRTIAERIHRQTERMSRLIADLVDFAGIQAGRVAIERKPHNADEILSATSEIFNPIARERGLQFEMRSMPNLPPIDCDSERAVQVMSNLVANALKVTPKGGAIAIGAELRVGAAPDDEVVFFVRDTGPGIEADELPQLFERYWRSKHAQYKGAGLGLSIARGIVDAHGGRIWAESQLGRGTTFYFSLASLRNN